MRRQMIVAGLTACLVITMSASALAGPPERTPQEPKGCEKQSAGPLKDYCDNDQ